MQRQMLQRKKAIVTKLAQRGKQRNIANVLQCIFTAYTKSIKTRLGINLNFEWGLVSRFKGEKGWCKRWVD
jgi:hypothetical protein